MNKWVELESSKILSDEYDFVADLIEYILKKNRVVNPEDPNIPKKRVMRILPDGNKFRLPDKYLLTCKSLRMVELLRNRLRELNDLSENRRITSFGNRVFKVKSERDFMLVDVTEEYTEEYADGGAT